VSASTESLAVARAPFKGASSAVSVLRRCTRAGVWLFLAAVALSALYPLFFIVSTALRSRQEYASSPAGLPKHLTTANFSQAFSSVHIGHLALDSLAVVVPAVVLITVISTLAAYALAHFDFPLKKTTLVVIVALMALPPTALLIPVFKLIVEAGLLNQRLGLILVYTALNVPFSVYLLASFMRSVPTELLKAAKIDGAGPLRTLWSVVVPLVRPGLLTLVTLNFLYLWNEFLFSLVMLPNEQSRTIMVGLAEFAGRAEQNLTVVSAGLLLSMVPPLIVFLFFQRSLVRGLTAGAVK
jgi:ABC-type glycerol-3-phosphate transport system permease component